MKILLGVCGGVAAYKAAELTRELQRRGAQVQVVMTAGAEKFVTPLTFASLSGHQVLTSLWEPTTSDSGAGELFDIEHIRVAQEVDVIVIAPATANTIAKLAQGTADDLLTTICLATKAPLVIAPAMNVNMWQHGATQANLDTLRTRGAIIVEPGSGELACGMVGEGRLAEIAVIADAILSAATPLHDLLGETILITAGGTREPIDPVRFLGNRSSGKMGFALAESAAGRGAHVILISAAGAAPLDCEQVLVNTAAEMQSTVLAHLSRATVVIMAAAVADYRMAQPAMQKLKKQDTLTLNLVRNDDILRQVVAHRNPGTTVIGFAAETENLREEAYRKLREKGIDAIIANDVSHTASGFEVDRNAGVLLTVSKEQIFPLSTKREMAHRILDQLAMIREHRFVSV